MDIKLDNLINRAESLISKLETLLPAEPLVPNWKADRMAMGNA